MKMRFHKLFYWHWSVTLLLLCVSVFIFATASVNIFVLLQANLTLIMEHGTQALRDGALQQLLELVASSIVSAVFYIIFKACERVLVEKLLQ